MITFQGFECYAVAVGLGSISISDTHETHKEGVGARRREPSPSKLGGGLRSLWGLAVHSRKCLFLDSFQAILNQTEAAKTMKR